jgi:cold-inducible RNA-binding protein
MTRDDSPHRMLICARKPASIVLGGRMASARGKEPEDESKAFRSRKTPAAHTLSLGEGDRPNPSMMLTLQNQRSLHALQRTVGNRAVVDMIASGRARTSPGTFVQREGGSAGSAVRSGTRLYVGNLSLSTSQQTLEAAFSAAGEVREVHLVTDRETGQPRGFGFVTMGSSREASAAISQFNGAMLDGRPLRVNEAQDRSTSGGGAGGGGRGGGGGGRAGSGGRGGGGGGGRGRY